MNASTRKPAAHTENSAIAFEGDGLSVPAEHAIAKPWHTGSKAFFSANAGSDALFAVQPGISAVEALENVSAFLCSAVAASHRLSIEVDEPELYSLGVLLEMAKGLVDSVVQGAIERSKA